ncbi:MAG TPA: hypothetical protein VGA69_00850 [Nitriliruptorales bacterium]
MTDNTTETEYVTETVLGELVVSEPTRGVRTSEFWLTVVGVAAIVALSLVGDLPADTAALAVTGATFGYGLSRGLAKRA